MDWITLGLAIIAYVLVCVSVVLSVWHRPARLTLALGAGVAVVHVAMVWGLRFDWSLQYALDKGLPGFVTFQVALAGMIAAALAREAIAPRRA